MTGVASRRMLDVDSGRIDLDRISGTKRLLLVLADGAAPAKACRASAILSRLLPACLDTAILSLNKEPRCRKTMNGGQEE